jgi:amino acid adenylation domain-containing protein/non-ribosomal peptide synthase protein (TIGR01720 family)
MKKETEKLSLLSRWKNREKKNDILNRIEKAPDGINIPLSHGQKRLWFLQQLYPKNAFYNYSETYTFSGQLIDAVLTDSFNRVYKDHDILRTTYHIENGEIFQRINNDTEVKIEVHDLSYLSFEDSKIESQKIIETNANAYFDLTKCPLVRAALIKLNPKTSILQITMHHIITDKWSMGIFREDLASYYRELSLKQGTTEKRSAIQYTDYALWQSKNEINRDGLNYWKNKLVGDIPFLNLPTDYKRPLHPTFKGATSFTQTYSKEHSLKLLLLSKQLETTPYVLMLSLYYVFLYRNSEQTDILIGSPVTNRDQKVLENLIGFFNETIILRTNIEPRISFKELVNKVHLNTLAAFEHKNIPFDKLVKELNVERSLSLNPFFQAMFLFHSVPENPFFDTNLSLTHTWYDSKVSKFDLTLYIAEEKGILSSTFEYSSDIFHESTINRFQDYFKSLIENVIINPNQSISGIPMLSDTEKKLLLNQENSISNNFTEFTRIHNIIEDIAKKHPNNSALTFEEHSITYKELNEKANHVAQELLKDSTTKNNIVGLCIDRSLDMIVGLLGILKAGYAYLPIDPEYPTQRIEFILKDAKVDNIVTKRSLLNLFDEFQVNPILMDTLNYSKDSLDSELPIVKETDLAYVIYTSGSTGHPKGVPITHKNIINSTGGRLDFYNENPSAFLLMSSISFDSSKAGIFWTLCTGGNLVITEKRIEQDLEQIANIIEQHKISHTLMLPSLYQVILENIETSKLKSLTTVMVAGEACSKSLCKTHFEIMPSVSLYNEYGPTEASVWCIAHKIEKEDLEKEQIPIGKPVANAQIYLLDSNKNKVPFGTSGEIYIGGEGLSKGYLNRPDLTNTVFTENPFNQNQKLYKTGDLAKYRNDGAIEFLGRIDQQIKIRGYRVELDDIENTINKSALVEKSVVIVKQDEEKSKRLIAYLKPNDSFDENQVKLQLKEELPDYMIPSSFVLIDEIPLLPNGKIDKKSLSLIEVISKPKDGNPIEKPKNDIEQKLLEIWKNILNINELSTNDNFFEIGGDSILSIQIIAKARKLGVSIAPNQLFEHQTISELAMFISYTSDTNPINEAMVTGKVPVTPIQEWFFDSHKTAPEFWNQIFTIKDLPKTSNQNSIKKITKNIIETHDALRSTFYFDHKKWNSLILKPEEIDAYTLVDISSEVPSNYDSKIESTLKHIQESMSLEKGTLFKCVYIETGDISKNSIILIAHHLVIDFVSWQIILNNYTDAIFKGEFINHDSRTASIKTWGNYLLEFSKSVTIADELDYWEKQVSAKNTFIQDLKVNLPICEKDVTSISLEIDKETTQNLTDKANNAYSTKVDELILSALIETLGKWTKSKTISLALERHGRETNMTDINLSNTVGWFTAFFPRTFDFEPNSDIESKIMATKEQMRNIPNGGIGYGLLRYLTPHLESATYPEIIFNFLGKQNTGEYNIEFASNGTRHPLSERHHLFEINALIKNGMLSIDWSYGNKLFDAKTMTSLMDDFYTSLRDIVNHCLNVENIKYTPSDFPDAELNQDDLDSLLDNIDF